MDIITGFFVLILALIVFALAVIVWCAPSFIASQNKSPYFDWIMLLNMAAIFVPNLWFVCLIWAIFSKP